MSELLATTTTTTWGHPGLTLTFDLRAGAAPTLTSVWSESTGLHEIAAGLPLMDVLVVDAGHALANTRLVHTAVGEDLVYVSHDTRDDESGVTLAIIADDPSRHLRVTMTLTSPWGAPAFTSRVRVENTGSEKSVVLQQVATWAAYAGRSPERGSEASDWVLTRGYSDWLAEGRWTGEALDALRMPDTASWLTGHNGRGAEVFASEGSWSTGKHIPVAILSSASHGFAWAWEVQHNGGWRFEVGRDIADVYFAVSGPTDSNHHWNVILEAGESFTSVPATIAVGADTTIAIAALTSFRRSARRRSADSEAMPIVFNDYMNTLNGDPTSDKLEPLIDAAAAVGADVFCIDAGWYDDTSDWWDSVGEWQPSTTRFRDGLGAIIRRIRDRGMVPGLWLEPEVVGVRSRMADDLPEEAFFSRHGVRVIEQERYHLDLRHPAAVAHLDSVVDRLVDEFGIGYFKLDYNINPGVGTDRDAVSPGSGMLDHNRAHLAWIDGLYRRHPEIVLENCASGAMRMDFAMLSRMDLQSTSDQQDPLLYPPIAAAAPVAMLPEQAANWAYPQPEMSPETSALTLTTSLLGRFYLSGHLDHMTDAQRGIVSEAITIARTLRAPVSTSTPFWPLGLPSWDAEWVAMGLLADGVAHVTLWNRTDAATAARVSLPQFVGHEIDVVTLFPKHLPDWPTTWDADTGVLHVEKGTTEPGARLFRITRLP
ncbi:Alpha-galactosidase [Frondihabitans sp. 762G35]|uniref:glycoside hydrolase family 36 protein n=1 Tax=Frondihabitans sp. 762G35 TaxID=1446794 RepID=UPI000D21A7AB|nr:glycoside hydrolase family 36 protein [Frondihabitans sp. 762G35]ARC58203.1 Alpha-galactosidase [Frondihabitans sp. 762G35]